MTTFFLSVLTGLLLYGLDMCIHTAGGMIAWTIGCLIGTIGTTLWLGRNNGN